MSETSSPSDFKPPSGKRIAQSAAAACIVAVIVLITVILPAEYGVDPTGIGRVTGFLELGQEPTRTLEIVDVTGGNETVFEAEIPDFGEPVPLPNPSIYQNADESARTETFQITIEAERETELKTVLETGKVILFTWQVDRGTVYSDFHGHDPEVSPDYWVRYREHQEGSGDNGSLVAPFAGEHGWYWLNYNEYPVTVTLTVTGYFEEVIDYSSLF